MSIEEILQALGEVGRLCAVTRLRVGEDKCKENCQFASKQNHRCLFKTPPALWGSLGILGERGKQKKLAHIAKVMSDLQEYCYGRDHSDERVHEDCPIKELCIDENMSVFNWPIITKTDIERLEREK